jgi:catechol 2,3-dioxygenase-like lactoylglutathione lyase family enzyme
MPASSFGLSQIGQIAITIKDIDRAVEFYRDTLGMRFLFRAGNMAFFDCGGIRLMLAPPEKPGEAFSSILYYRVDEIQRAFETLSERGVKFEGKPHLVAKLEKHDLWMAFFRDMDGNLLALMSETPRN